MGTIQKVFHTNLSAYDHTQEYWVSVNGLRYPLALHDTTSLAQARSEAPMLASIPDSRLTHYTPAAVPVPDDVVMRVVVARALPKFGPSASGVCLAALHIPAAASTATAGGRVHQAVDYGQTAQTLLFHHPGLLSNSPTAAAIVTGYMTNDPTVSDAIANLAQAMNHEDVNGPGWTTPIPVTPEAFGEFDGTTTYTMSQPATDIVNSRDAQTALSRMLILTKNDAGLQNVKWRTQNGTSVTSSAAGAGGSGVVSMATIEAAEGTDSWNATLANTNAVHGLQTSMTVTDASTMTVQLTFDNFYIRYLGAFISFQDKDGKVIPGSITPVGGASLDVEILSDLGYPGPDLEKAGYTYLGFIGPVDNIIGVPIYSAPGELVVSVQFPADAVRATLYGSGLGTGDNSQPLMPLVGGVLTGLLNLAIPGFMLGFEVAAQSYKPLYTIVQTAMNDKAVVGMLVGAISVFDGAQIGVSASNKKVDWSAIQNLIGMLFKKAMSSLLTWVEEQTVTKKVADAIPVAGWIMVALDIATGLAQMSETIAEVATSPWNIENTISTAVTTTVTVHHDPRNQALPAGTGRSCVVHMTYQDETRPTVSSGSIAVADNYGSPTLTTTFSNNTLGGYVKFDVQFFVGDWPAAKAATGWMANDESDVTSVDLYLVEIPHPLTASTRYEHSQLLVYENNAFGWQATGTAPTGTPDASGGDGSHSLSVWSGLTLSQREGMLGFAYQGANASPDGSGGDAYAIENVSIPGTSPSSVRLPVKGFSGRTQITYDPYAPKYKTTSDGQWVAGPGGAPVLDPSDFGLGAYYVDSSNGDGNIAEGGGYHLRKIALDGSASDSSSYGRFVFSPDSIAIHPSGHVIGLHCEPAAGNTVQEAALQVLKLPTTADASGKKTITGVSDVDAPVASVYSGPAIEPTRAGLMFFPVAVSCGDDGTIFVLENSRSSAQVIARIQAFDLYGNPVNRFFLGNNFTGTHPTPFLQLAAGGDITYLDLAAVGNEKMTYLFVLYSDGSAAANFHVATYQYGQQMPATNPVLTTDSVAAARVTVDMWHTLYALNYDVLTDGNGKSAGPPTSSGFATLPSVSQWVPVG